MFAPSAPVPLAYFTPRAIQSARSLATVFAILAAIGLLAAPNQGRGQTPGAAPAKPAALPAKTPIPVPARPATLPAKTPVPVPAKPAATLPAKRAAALPAKPATTAAQPILEGIVRPTALYEKSTIAVPFFNVTGGLSLEPESLSRVIRRDLELSGYFNLLDAQTANSLNLRDVRTQQIAFGKWRDLGVQHYLMGSCSPGSGAGQINVLTYLYYIPPATEDPDPSKTFAADPKKLIIFQKTFYGKAADYRDAAHQISDEVVKYLKGADGIARTRIAYITDRTGKRVKEVAAMDADGYGQNLPPITRHNKLCAAPCWGAAGTEIYFTSYRDFNPDLYGVTLAGGKEWYISRQPGLNTLPDWNEALKKVVFVLSKDGNSELYTCDRSGGGLKRLTTSRQIESSPCWSPDGSQIAFTSDREGGHPQVFVMSANGSGVRRVTRQGGWNDAPAWSPKGDKLAFVSRSAEGTFDIYTCAPSGENSTWRRLTMNQGDNEAPTWAPDGRHLAFSSNRSGTWQVYMMLDDGANQQQLTLLGSNQQPTWGPAVK